MLGKLIKHEWKNTYKAGCLILLGLAAVTFMGWLSFQSPMWRSLTHGDYAVYNVPFSGLLDVLSIFTLLLYAIMLVAAILGILIFLALHFYRTMYGGEGYLTHTLPVTKNKLLISKILVGGIWFLIVTLAVIASMVALVSILIATALSGEYTVGEFWRMFFDAIRTLMRAIVEELEIDLSIRMAGGIIWFLIEPFLSLCIIFGAISMGQLFTKHRVLMAIVSYIGVSIVSGILQSVMETIVLIPFTVSTDAMVIRYMDGTSVISSVTQLVMAVGMYAVSYAVVSKKLNLE